MSDDIYVIFGGSKKFPPRIIGREQEIREISQEQYNSFIEKRYNYEQNLLKEIFEQND